MKKRYTYFLLFCLFGIAVQAQAQVCKKTCVVEKEVGEGVFLGVQIHSHKEKPGVHVVQVIEGTQAEKMGIQKGDFIYTINDVAMGDSPFMVKWVQQQYAGMPITVQLQRKGEDIRMKGELGYKTLKMVSETICCDPTIGKLQLADFEAYPNPSRGEFSLQFDTESPSAVDVQIVNLQGNIVFEETVYPSGNRVNERVAVQGAISGEHILVLHQDGKIAEHKMVFIR